MTPAELYRAKAAELDALARMDVSPSAKAEYARMAKGYRHLAEVAEHNAKTDLTYEPPMYTGSDAPDSTNDNNTR